MPFLSAVFAELGEDPGKAKKYPPDSADDFAAKYVVGKFTYVANIARIRERALERSGGDRDLAEAMEENPPDELPEEMLQGEESMHPATVLKAMFPDVPDDAIDYVLEASGGNLEEAAAGLWFMKVMQSFVKTSSTSTPVAEVRMR
jgi:hypothetical protein